MRQLWVGIIVVIVVLALGVGRAYGASLLVRNRLANLPAASSRLNRNVPSGQPGNNSRRFNNPFMNPGGQPGSGLNGFRNRGGRGPMMGPGMRGPGFFNCPVPNQGQNPGTGQGQNPNNCPPFNQQVTPTPGAPDNGAGNGPF
jgi:hypothetical protein